MILQLFTTQREQFSKNVRKIARARSQTASRPCVFLRNIFRIHEKLKLSPRNRTDISNIKASYRRITHIRPYIRHPRERPTFNLENSLRRSATFILHALKLLQRRYKRKRLEFATKRSL